MRQRAKLPRMLGALVSVAGVTTSDAHAQQTVPGPVRDLRPPLSPSSPPDPRDRTRPPTDDIAVSVPIEMALADISDAYRGIVAEEVTVRLSEIRPKPGANGNGGGRPGPKRGDSIERFIVRLERHGGERDGIARLKLEFETFHAMFEDGWMIAESASGGSRVFERAIKGEISPELLETIMPPVPAISIAIASDQSRVGGGDGGGGEAGRGLLANPTPFTRHVSWVGAEAIDDVAGARIVLHGRPGGPRSVAGDAECTLIADARTGRVRRFESVIPQPTGPMRLTLDCRAIDAGEPATWAIPTANRTRVETLAGLLREAGEASKVGDRTQDLMLSCMGGGSWSMHGALRRAVADGVADPVALVLVYRASTKEEAFSQAEREGLAGLAAMRGVVERIGAGTAGNGEASARFITRAAVAIAPADWTPEWPGYLYERWGVNATRAAPTLDADALCWSQSPGSVIDRFVPGSGGGGAAGGGARAIIVCVDREFVLRGVVRLEGREGDAAGIERELMGVLGLVVK